MKESRFLLRYTSRQGYVVGGGVSFRAKWVSVNSGRTGLITKQRIDRVAIHGRFRAIHRLDTGWQALIPLDLTRENEVAGPFSSAPHCGNTLC